MTGIYLDNMEKPGGINRISLTIDTMFWYDKFVGVVWKPPFFIEVSL